MIGKSLRGVQRNKENAYYSSYLCVCVVVVGGVNYLLFSNKMDFLRRCRATMQNELADDTWPIDFAYTI